MSFLGQIFAMNLRTKFILPISTMLVVSLLVVSTYLIDRQSKGFLRELETSAYTISQIVAVNAESGVLFGSQYELDELLQIPSRFEGVIYLSITNMNGKVLAEAGKGRTDDYEVLRGMTDDRPSGTSERFYYLNSEKMEVLVLKVPVTTRKRSYTREHLGMGASGPGDDLAETEQIGMVELGMAVEPVRERIEEAKALAILLTIVVVIASIFVLAFIVSAITRPIRRLVEVTDLVSHGDLDLDVGIDRNDEIGHLAKTFNKMIQSLRLSRVEIEGYNRTLEDKIIERTQQLEDAQAQLIQSEKLSAIGQLAAGVAHELNNPLGGILGYAQFSLEKLRKNIPEKTTTKEIESYIRYVSDIEIQARRCKAIVQNLLRFSRSSRSIDFEELNINKVLEETITFVEHQLQINEIDLQMSLPDDLPLLNGNAGQLQQVFTNLIINSMHAMVPGGILSILSRLSPSLGEFGGAIELLFTDTGCGIPEENIKKIFEPFFTTKDIGKGTGLGLSVSYGIIREHGGEIIVASVPGQGTTFTVVLPIQKPQDSADNISNVAISDRLK